MAATGAFGQVLGGDSQIDRPWRIQVGAFFPSDAALRSFAGTTHFAIGGSYDTKQSNLMDNTLYQGFYGDATFGNKSGGHSSVYGGGYQVRLGFGGPGKPLNTTVYPYIGGGLGIYGIDDNILGTSTSFRLGGKLFAGVESTSGIYLQGAYSLVGSAHHYQPSGFTVTLGLRF